MSLVDTAEKLSTHWEVFCLDWQLINYPRNARYCLRFVFRRRPLFVLQTKFAIVSERCTLVLATSIEKSMREHMENHKR